MRSDDRKICLTCDVCKKRKLYVIRYYRKYISLFFLSIKISRLKVSMREVKNPRQNEVDEKYDMYLFYVYVILGTLGDSFRFASASAGISFDYLRVSQFPLSFPRGRRSCSVKKNNFSWRLVIRSIKQLLFRGTRGNTPKGSPSSERRNSLANVNRELWNRWANDLDECFPN